MSSKPVVSTLVPICFGSARLGSTIETNCIKFQTIDPEICSVLTF